MLTHAHPLIEKEKQHETLVMRLSLSETTASSYAACYYLNLYKYYVKRPRVLEGISGWLKY